MNPSTEDITRFRDQISDLMGMYFDASKFSSLATVLQLRARARKVDTATYLDQLAGLAQEEMRLLARELTITETYFLRYLDQFNALAQVALPTRLAAVNGKRSIELLSAGCASGEEAYSLAITMREQCAAAAGCVSITAIDLNPAMLQKAELGRYSTWSLRDLSEPLKQRWFSADGNAFNLSPEIRRTVRFESRNLALPETDFWLPERFDIVFCRNVLMYFSIGQAQLAIERIARAMVPGGYFFLGHAETLRGLSDDFELCHSHNTFYYRRKETLGLPLSRICAAAPAQIAPRMQAAADASWINDIQQASDRIRVLTAEVKPGTADATINSGKSAREQLTEHATVLLHRAVTLSHSGELPQAEAICMQLLLRTECGAEAHYLLALCKEGAGDLSAAVEHDQAALLLDSEFAMPRLHLGMMARRQGELHSARTELGLALYLLKNEDATRIGLFGGGFRREALHAMCHAELTALGGQA